MAEQKIKPRGLKKFKLGGGENAKADYDSMIDDGYHAMDDEGIAKKAMNNLRETGLNPPSPGDVKNALRKRVPEPEFDRESTRNPIKMYKTPVKMYSPIKKALVGDQDQLPEQLKQEILDSPAKMYDSPTKFVGPGMTPMATGGGFKMKMGSKENFSGSNFSNKDQGTMAAAPSIMKDNYGGESIELKDQGQKKTDDGTPLNYGMRGQTKVERKMTRAENEQAGADKKAEQKRQYLKDAMAVVQTGANVASAFIPGK